MTMNYQRLLLVLAAAVLGCNESDPPVAPPEPSWQSQIAAVREGKSDRIEVTQHTIGDEQLRKLAGLDGLRELSIEKGKITSAALPVLAKLPALERLKIRGARIDDEGFKKLCTIQSLQRINLPQADLTDAGLAVVAELPNVEFLRFGSPRVTDAGIAAACQAKTLRWLHLIDIPIGDASLRSIAQLPQLESLYIDGAKLSDDAWDELFRARPKLHVHVDQKHHDRDPHGHAH